MTLPSKILLGTQNKSKITLFKSILENHNIQSILLPQGIGETTEDADTFEENALLKARYYAKVTSSSCLSDDSGLVIPALGGFPGLFTARFAQKSGGYLQAFHVLKERLKDKEKKAFIVAAVALVTPSGKFYVKKHALEGRLDFSFMDAPQGFGFTPIFIPYGDDLPLGAMTFEKQLFLTPRRKALESILKCHVSRETPSHAETD